MFQHSCEVNDTNRLTFEQLCNHFSLRPAEELK